MRVAVAFVGLGLVFPVHAASPCGAVVEAKDRASYWLTASASSVALYRCSAAHCDELVGSKSRTSVQSQLADGLATEKVQLDKAIDCVEARALEENDLISRLSTFTPTERELFHARHGITLAETRALRSRLNAFTGATTKFRSHLDSPTWRWSLTPDQEPLLHRLALEIFR
jgi:hypothetical protein